MADRPPRFTPWSDDAASRIRWDRQRGTFSTVRSTPSLPVSVVVTLTAVAFAVSARMAHAEPDFPHHPPVACLALVAVILTTVVAERSLGSLRTLVIGVGAPLLAVGATL